MFNLGKSKHIFKANVSVSFMATDEYKDTNEINSENGGKRRASKLGPVPLRRDDCPPRLIKPHPAHLWTRPRGHYPMADARLI